MPRFSPPKKQRDMLYYSDESKRGYLAPKMLRIFQSLPGYNWRYIVRKRPLLSTTHISADNVIRGKVTLPSGA